MKDVVGGQRYHDTPPVDPLGRKPNIDLVPGDLDLWYRG